MTTPLRAYSATFTRQKEVGAPVVVDVGCRNAAVTLAVRNAGCLGNVGESPPVVPEQGVGLGLRIRDVEVEVAIIVIIEPCRATHTITPSINALPHKIESVRHLVQYARQYRHGDWRGGRSDSRSSGSLGTRCDHRVRATARGKEHCQERTKESHELGCHERFLIV